MPKTMFENVKTGTVNALIKSLDLHPDEWSWGSDRFSTIVHKAGNITLYVKHEIYISDPHEIRFSFWERLKLRQAFKRWMKAHGHKTEMDKKTDAYLDVVAKLNYPKDK